MVTIGTLGALTERLRTSLMAISNGRLTSARLSSFPSSSSSSSLLRLPLLARITVSASDRSRGEDFKERSVGYNEETYLLRLKSLHRKKD